MLVQQRDAEQEEDRYALLKAESDVKLAELDVRKNPLVPAITAKQNTLALEAAQEKALALFDAIETVDREKLAKSLADAAQKAGLDSANSDFAALSGGGPTASTASLGSTSAPAAA